MFDAAKEEDEKSGNGEYQLTLKRNGETFQLTETIMSLNLVPGFVATAGMISFGYNAGRSNYILVWPFLALVYV